MDTAQHEQTILAQILLDDRILNETTLTTDSFIDHANASIFRSMLVLHERNIRPDIVTIHDHDPSISAGFLARLSSISCSSANWRYYEKVIQDAWKRRRLYTAGTMLHESEEEPDLIMENLERQITEVQEATGRNFVVKTGSIIAGHLKEIEERYKNRGRLPGLPTGFSKLDRMTMGLRPRLLYAIGGRPSQGKSALSLNIAQHLAMKENVSVGYISLESSSKEVMNRMIATDARINGEKIMSGYLEPQDFTRIMEVSEKIYEAPFFIWDQPNASITDIHSVGRYMKRQNKVKAIFVDYLQLIRVPGAEDRKAATAEASMVLKAMARELEIPIVVNAQLGRDADNKRPTLGDFQWSSQIEQDADVAMLLWNPSKDEKVEQIYLLVEKCRDGKRGKIELRFERSFVSFTENIDAEGY